MKVSVSTSNLNDFIYVSDFYIGTPPQKMRGVFDTGSTNTWVLNENTKLPGDPEKMFAFAQDKSSTFKETKQEAHILFGSGSTDGKFAIDDIRLGGCDGTSGGLIYIKDQKFGNTENTDIFNGNNFEAIVGMAYPELAEPNVTPLFDNMMNQKVL
jgi:hypothetical protein